ncbi:Homeobox protein Dlx1a [Liparis tanakae]|uniref:Homeobox protein Dlx1a n=1 Tax=Liparis tanakae TaxID=230148 RepID=A0A4Z2GZN7_9TELE|nr:Homeobox protein Dlx1a [Liparis tanakae]
MSPYVKWSVKMQPLLESQQKWLRKDNITATTTTTTTTTTAALPPPSSSLPTPSSLRVFPVSEVRAERRLRCPKSRSAGVLMGRVLRRPPGLRCLCRAVPGRTDIMSPDYVTTGIVSDHRDIKDGDLIQRQLQVLFCHVPLGKLFPTVFKTFSKCAEEMLKTSQKVEMEGLRMEQPGCVAALHRHQNKCCSVHMNPNKLLDYFFFFLFHQHDSYSPASSFPRSLGYPYVNSVGSHSTSPYLSTVQTYQNSSALTQTRLEETAPEAEKNTVVEGGEVKIWFQNKRSKFKKLMKQGGGTIDTAALATGRGLSSGSPSVAPVWSSPTTVKTSVGTTGSYIPSYTSWYPTAHQESMQQSQLM